MRGAAAAAVAVLMCAWIWGGAESASARQALSKALSRRQMRVAAEQRAMNDHLKKIAPYGIVETNMDTLLDRVASKVGSEIKKVEKKHGQRMVAENLIYENRLHAAEAKLRKLEEQRRALTDTDLALKAQRANLTKAYRAAEAKMDVATGEVEEMKVVLIKEARLIDEELQAKLEALNDQKAKAEAILAEELGVVRSVRSLILNLVKLNETRVLEEARKRIEAVQKAILARSNGVNMTELGKEADELSAVGSDLVREEQLEKNKTVTREKLDQKSKFEDAVQDLIVSGEQLETEATEIVEASKPKKAPVVANVTNGTSAATTTERLDEMLTTVNNSMAPLPKPNPDEINLITGMPEGFHGAPKPTDDGGSDAVFSDVAKNVVGGLHAPASVVETDRLTDGLFVNKYMPRNVNMINGLPNADGTDPPKPEPAARRR